MPVYVDTGLFLKLYLNEPDSPKALALVAKFSSPICLTPFLRAELVNTLRCKEGRGEVTGADVAKALTDLRADLRAGFVVRFGPDWDRVFAGTIRLSQVHAATTLCRTLDAIHVATALHLGIAEFATADKRQSLLARAAGLTVLGI